MRNKNDTHERGIFMFDIFKLIRADVEREERPVQKQPPAPAKDNRLKLDSFIIGEEDSKLEQLNTPEKPERKKKTSLDKEKLGASSLDREIGATSQSKDFLSDIVKIDYVKLDKKPKDQQLKILKKEYLLMLDRIGEISKEFSKVDKSFQEQSVDYESMKKTIAKLKEFIRIIGNMMPDGMELKAILETPAWNIDEIEDDLIGRLNFVINRAKNIDEYVDEATLNLRNQVQGLQNKLTKTENRNLELEQEVDQLYDRLDRAIYAEDEDENVYEESEYTSEEEITEEQYDDDVYEEEGYEEDIYEDTDSEDYDDDDVYETPISLNRTAHEEEEEIDEDDEDIYETPSHHSKKETQKSDDFNDIYSSEYGDAFEDDDEEPVKLTPSKPSRPTSKPTAPRAKEKQQLEEKRNTSRPVSKKETSSKDTHHKQSSTPSNPPRVKKEQETTKRPQSSRPTRNEQLSPNEGKAPARKNETEQRKQRPQQREEKRTTRPERTTRTDETATTNESRERSKRPQRPERTTRPERSARPERKSSRPEPVEEVATNKRELDDTYNPNQVMDVDPYLESLTNEAKYIIRLVGELGVSRNAELREVLHEREDAKEFFFNGTKFQKNNMTNSVNDLINAQIFTNEQINLGSRGSIFKVYELTDLGKHIYFALSNEIPVKSEMAMLVRQHASAEHGFLIKDSADIFKKMGYTVYTDHKDLRHDLEGGKRKDFDLIIEKGDEKCFIEVERGTHSDSDFFNAMDKIRKITEEFYFICPSEDILFNKTKRQFFMWIQKHLGGMDQARGIKANFTTFGKLKEGKKPLWDDIEL